MGSQESVAVGAGGHLVFLVSLLSYPFILFLSPLSFTLAQCSHGQI